MAREEDRVANRLQRRVLRAMPRHAGPPAVSSDTIEAGAGY